MHALRRRRQLVGWFALLAVLLAALVPTVSHALAQEPGQGWVAVCSAQGTTWVQADANAADGEHALAHALEHCPFCTLHAPAAGPAAATGLVLLAPWLAHALPLTYLAAPRTLHAWVQAQPRAPPLFS